MEPSATPSTGPLVDALKAGRARGDEWPFVRRPGDRGGLGRIASLDVGDQDTPDCGTSQFEGRLLQYCIRPRMM